MHIFSQQNINYAGGNTCLRIGQYCKFRKIKYVKGEKPYKCLVYIYHLHIISNNIYFYSA